MVCGHAHWTCPSLEVHLNQNFPRWFCLFLCIGEELISVDLKVGKQPIEIVEASNEYKKVIFKIPRNRTITNPQTPCLGVAFPLSFSWSLQLQPVRKQNAFSSKPANDLKRNEHNLWRVLASLFAISVKSRNYFLHR